MVRSNCAPEFDGKKHSILSEFWKNCEFLELVVENAGKENSCSDPQLHYRRPSSAFVLRRLGNGFHMGMRLQILPKGFA